MSSIPAELKYTQSHEWIGVEADGSVRIGISDHAQEELGDLVFVELPELGAAFSAGDPCAVIESVKAASDIYPPVSGEIVAINDALDDAPELLNESPFDGGWMFRIKASNLAELENLLSAEAYLAQNQD